MTKECGDCSMCCKLLAIDELNKPRDSWCPHVVRKKGCGIYQTRPAPCRSFLCVWLLDERLDERWKPNKCKMLLAAEGPDHVVVYVDKGANQPWAKEPFLSTLRGIAARGYEMGGMVTVSENEETIVILPDRGVNLGVLQPGEAIFLPKGPDGRIAPRVVQADQLERLKKEDLEERLRAAAQRG